jgi:hypothetical protein
MSTKQQDIRTTFNSDIFRCNLLVITVAPFLSSCQLIDKGFEIDEHLKERTQALGVQGHLWVDRRIRGWLFVALDVGIEHAFDPIGAPTFFNAPLGSNTILCLTVGPMAVF